MPNTKFFFLLVSRIKTIQRKVYIAKNVLRILSSSKEIQTLIFFSFQGSVRIQQEKRY